ncbi:hypothetical protein Tco_0781394 [Tanacetum coccineum]
MDITRDQQIALDDALVTPANQLKIGKSNIRLSSNLKSKEATLQVVYDVLKLTPFYKAFQITVDQFEEPPFEEEILTFLRDLGHNGEIKVVSRHEDTQAIMDSILLDELTNEAIKDSESYKEYYVIALGAEPPKTKASVKKKQVGSDKTKSPPTAKGKKAEQMKLATKEVYTKRTAPTASGSGADRRNCDEKMMMKTSDDDFDDDADNQDDEGQDDDNEKTNSDNDGDDFVHPKFSTDDQEERQDEEDNEEEGSDLRVQTPSHYESTDDEESNEVTHGVNVEGEELDEEAINEEDEANELYRDVNVNLEGIDTEMTDVPRTIIQTTQVIEDTHVIITLVNLKCQQ